MASYKNLTTIIPAGTSRLIGAKAPGASATIIANCGPGDLVYKTGSAPSSPLDGIPLGIPDTVTKQGGSLILLGADVAISDEIYGYSAAGTTVHVEQGSPS